MADFQLTYFNGRGRGEISRLALSFSKKKWEDKRIEFADWPALKPKTPFGSLPMLTVGGKNYGQGMAIASYLAREFGLYGSSNIEALKIDQIQNLREDLLVAEAKGMFEKDEAKKAEIMKGLQEDTYPKVLGIFNDTIKENKTGFTVGKKFSLADFVVMVGTDTVANNSPDILDKYPEIKAVRAKVAAADGIKQYLAKRPETPF